MSNTLAIPENELVGKYADDKAFQELATSSKFLPRLSLTSGQSDKVMDGKIGQGRWCLESSKNNIEDLGVEFRAYICGMRLKAIDTNAHPIVAYFDSSKPQFQKIVERAKNEKTGPLAGPEFLVYIPAPHDRFCLYFMCSTTAKREAPLVRQLLGKAATFKVTTLSNVEHKWYGPVITPCTIPLPMPSDMEKFNSTRKAFLNPPESDVEEASEEEKTATKRET